MASRRTRQIIFILVGLGLLLGLLLPAFIHAASDSPACTRLASFSDKANAEFGNRETKLADARTKRDTDLANKIDKRDTKITDQRTKFDTNLDDQIVKLEKRATTAEQTAAVNEFEQTVRTAVATRRTAVDAARQTFRDGVQMAISDHRSAVDQEITDFKAKLDAAFTKAQSDCAAGVDPSTVRSDLRTAVRAAKDDLKLDRAGNSKVGPEVVKLVSDRRSAVEKARADFKTTVEAARVKLKDALGVRAG